MRHCCVVLLCLWCVKEVWLATDLVFYLSFILGSGGSLCFYPWRARGVVNVREGKLTILHHLRWSIMPKPVVCRLWHLCYRKWLQLSSWWRCLLDERSALFIILWALWRLSSHRCGLINNLLLELFELISFFFRSCFYEEEIIAKIILLARLFCLFHEPRVNLLRCISLLRWGL